MRAENRAEPTGLCPWLSALFLAESDKLRCGSPSVCGMGRGWWDGLAIEMAAEVTSPGMIGGGGVWGVDLMIEGFGVHDFSLTLRFMVDGVREGFVLIQDRDDSLRIFTDGDLSFTQGIPWAVGLDLVNDLVGLDGQVFGEDAGFLMGQDQVQVLGLE